jgi:hypothetical protein
VEEAQPPDAVAGEIAWRLQGGTPHDIEVARGVQWAHEYYLHPPLVAIVNRQDRTHATYFSSLEEAEGFIGKLRDAMARAWPAVSNRKP